LENHSLMVMTTGDILTVHNQTFVAGTAVATYSTNFNQAVCGSNETTSLPPPSFEKFRMHGVESNCRHGIVRKIKPAGCGSFYPTEPGLEAPAEKEMALNNDSSILPPSHSSASHLGNWTGTGIGMGYRLPTGSGERVDKNNKAPNETSQKWPPPFTGPPSIFSAIPTPFGKGSTEGATTDDAITAFSPGDNIDGTRSAKAYTPKATTESSSITSQGPPSDVDPALLSRIAESCHPSGRHDPAFLYTCIRGALQSATEISQSLITEAPSVTVISSSESSPSTNTTCDVSPHAAI
jgi:hypothetical protein